MRASTKSVDVTNLRAVMKRTKTQRSRTSWEDNGSGVRHLVRTMAPVADFLGGQWEQWQTSCEDNGSSGRLLGGTMVAVADIFLVMANTGRKKNLLSNQQLLNSLDNYISKVTVTDHMTYSYFHLDVEVDRHSDYHGVEQMQHNHLDLLSLPQLSDKLAQISGNN
uniref:(California timema) hypothetical protein n=1 Tax=Timema californicum TaxID=61474 RepID=A0A7R9PB50_TIMCA|nr:unnamed protein product [Timema californicum]